jgi:NAD(P)-dependent dehydrogenase (short-subunit alcohol dehydrogenase family)|tara:strand:+ start:1226 stop:1987 length:762 start_codon:yes stop_codon:yes gene_type:complete
MKRRCVCITGSTHGIGFGIAKAFAKEGARLVINSHQPDTEAASYLGKLTECHFVKADLSSVDGARSLILQAHKALGRIDTLVNNAGTFTDKAFAEIDEPMFNIAFNLNVKGYLFASQAFSELVQGGHENASIICIGSTNSLAAEKNSVIYDSSKGAVLMMVRSLALSLAERGIRVNGIGPGIIETPLTQPGLDHPGVRGVLEAQIPLGKLGKPEDIGGATVFLASEKASYISGQMLYIDGGIVARQMSWEVSS